MKKLQYFFALYVAKAAQGFLKILGRNATYLPGKIAIRLCKDFLKYHTPPKTVIAITGTNGKTTTSNLVTSILRTNGYSITNNSYGSNVQAGVISALIEDTDLRGRPKKDIAVLEVDERSSLLVYPHLKPDFLVCNNIMRDSIKRNAHTEFISYIISSALTASTKMIVNADDLIAANIGHPEASRVYFGLEAEQPEVSLPQHILDIVYCPACGGNLKSEYVRYNHIGRHYCEKCGMRSPAPNYAVTEINRTENTFTVRIQEQTATFRLVNDNVVNVYNSCGVVALLSELGLTAEQIAKGFDNVEIVKTRFDSVQSGDLNITLLMSKGQNPIACSRCFDYVAKAPCDDKGVIVMIDDLHDNDHDSEATCWLYDCDYAAFADPSVKQVLFAGPRGKDHYLRALLAGVDPAKILTTESCADAAKHIDTEICKNIYVLHDLYRPDDAESNKRILVAKGAEGKV